MTKRELTGTRLCIWIPQKDYHILEAIRKLRLWREENRLPSSEGDIVRDLLMEGIESLRSKHGA